MKPEIHKFIVVYRLASGLKHLAVFDYVRALPEFQTTHHKDTSLVIRDHQLTIGWLVSNFRFWATKMEGVLIEVLQQAKEAGCSASLTFTTSGDKIKANLDINMERSSPSSECSTPRSCSTTPSTKSTERAASHQTSLALPSLTSPSPPTNSLQKLAEVLRRKTRTRSMDSDSSEEEEADCKGVVVMDGRSSCIFCNVDVHEPYSVEPDSFLDECGTKPIVNIFCDICKIKGMMIATNSSYSWALTMEHVKLVWKPLNLIEILLSLL